MTPVERICAAIRGDETDYLPCSIYFNRNLRAEGFDCSRLEDRTGLSLYLGVDPFVGVGLGRSLHRAVETHTWVEHPSEETYPVLWQAWDTPAGRLTQAVRQDDACAGWTSIGWSDATASSMYKPLIENPEDVERFAYLCQPLTEADFERSDEARKPAFAHAAEHQLPLVCTYGQGLAVNMFTMGAERSVLFAVDEPEAFERMAEIVHQAAMRNIELAARSGVHILKRFGGYEMCNFYNPEIYRRVCVPHLRREVECAHDHDLLIYYRIVTGTEPLLQDIAGLGFDCIEGGEPHLSNCSLEQWQAAFDGRAASWTGVSTPVLLGGDDPEAVRAEVRHCVEVFDRHRFILGVTNSIRRHFPWENTLAMVDEWRKIR